MKKIINILAMVIVLILCSEFGKNLSAANLTTVKGDRTETETTIKDQKDIFVTIYNKDIALIREKRKLAIPKGESVLAFKGVSGKIIPETALLKVLKLKVLEQNFEFDLLTPQSLLKKFTGCNVKIVKINPATGKEKIVEAKVLSTVNGVVLKLDNGIETGTPGRIVFPYIPKNFRTSPTLTMLVKSKIRQPQELELSYLTRGLTWRSDYVAKLNDSDTALDLSGWVTLTNTSGTSYNHARLKLVAGDINLSPGKRNYYMKTPKMEALAVTGQAFSREQLFEYHLYSLNRKTDIKDNQTKQVALLHGENIPCKKEFVLMETGRSCYYRRYADNSNSRLKVSIYLKFKNSKKNHLGIPVPKGIIRLYKEDTKGNLQFAGEDSIDHTPENAVISLKLGNAFDITAKKRQTDFIKLNATGYNTYKYQSSYEIKIMNSKSKPVSVKIVEPVHGQWIITKENFPHTRTDAEHAVWNISVPAKDITTLKYTIRVR